MSTTRLITLGDAPALAAIVRANRAFLAPWEPARSEDYYTVDGQLMMVEDALARCEQGTSLPHVILDEAGRVAGRITLSGIVRGPFQSCSVGYWLAESACGRGLATAALREVAGLAFGRLGLHRVQAEAMPHNVRSRRVLERSGFAEIGMAPAYLKIAGAWRDHVLYQVINPA